MATHQESASSIIALFDKAMCLQKLGNYREMKRVLINLEV
jgi:hypothetical protein